MHLQVKKQKQKKGSQSVHVRPAGKRDSQMTGCLFGEIGALVL